MAVTKHFGVTVTAYRTVTHTTSGVMYLQSSCLILFKYMYCKQVTGTIVVTMSGTLVTDYVTRTRGIDCKFHFSVLLPNQFRVITYAIDQSFFG